MIIVVCVVVSAFVGLASGFLGARLFVLWFLDHLAKRLERKEDRWTP